MSASVVALLFCAWWTEPALAHASSYDWYLQLHTHAVDERAVRQTITLELSEIEIPSDPYRDESVDGPVSLHIEISESEARLIVALWDRGELAGRRSVTTSEQARLVARRIGLAVAELARELRDRRVRAARIMAQEQDFVQRRALVSAYRAQQRALGLRAGLRTELITQGAFLFGPTLGAEFNNQFPLRLVVGVSWGTGWIGAFDQESNSARVPTWSKWQLEWGAEWVAQPNQRTQLSVGGHFAANVVHVNSAVSVDGMDDQQATWGAQLGLRLAWAVELGSVVWPRFEVEGGRLLRPLPMQQGNEELTLGGWYASLGVSAVVFQ